MSTQGKFVRKGRQAVIESNLQLLTNIVLQLTKRVQNLETLASPKPPEKESKEENV